MSRDRIAAAAVIVAGLISGPWMLISARAAQPPITWPDLPFILVMSVVGVFTVIGFQALVRQPRAMRFFWAFMALVGLYLLGSGVSALATAAVGGTLDAAALLFLMVGAGATSGAALCKVVFRARFAT